MRRFDFTIICKNAAILRTTAIESCSPYKAFMDRDTHMTTALILVIYMGMIRMIILVFFGALELRLSTNLVHMDLFAIASIGGALNYWRVM